LNFIGGNPVNLQIILTKAATSARTEAYTAPDERSSEFLSSLAEMDDFKDFNKLLKSVLIYTGSGQLGIYSYDKSSLALKIHINDENNAKFANSEISETSVVHLLVADSGQEYSFTDDKSVQRAIEKSGNAPHEFVTSFIAVSNKQYVLRYIFDEKIEGKEAVEAVKRAGRGSRILQKLIDLIGKID
jgi:hypothetical protein